jgi:serine/threonine protein kinase
MINNKYEILNIINTGSYGNVYKVKYNNELYALKEETQNNSILFNEANIYKELRFIKNVGKIKDYFYYNNKNYLVLNLYDKNLVHIKYEKYNSINYINLIKNIFKMLFTTLESIHNYGYLHRDIKPSNICLDKSLQPYIIDFGLSKKYIINNKHIKEKKIHAIIGSYSFISKNVENLIEPSRRDDIESMIYVYIYMLMDKCYEKYINNIKNISNENIKNILLSSNIDNILITNILKILDYVRLLNFDQTPKYNYLLDFF